MNVDPLPNAFQQPQVIDGIKAERLLRHISDFVFDEDTDTGEDRSQEGEETLALKRHFGTAARRFSGILNRNDQEKILHVVSLTVILSRRKKQKWGFVWDRYKFFAKEQR